MGHLSAGDQMLDAQKRVAVCVALVDDDAVERQTV
jgi:hypothetical protein